MTRDALRVVLAAVWLLAGGLALAQDIDVNRVVSELEPEIERAMLEGKIPSCTVALVAGEEIVWTGAYGHSNLWARTPAVPSTVYLIGSTFKTMATAALLQQMEKGRSEGFQAESQSRRERKKRSDSRPQSIGYNRLMSQTGNSVLERLLDPVSNCLTREVAQKLVGLRADPELQDRMDALAERCNEGRLSESEEREYDTYVRAIDFITILQLKARSILKDKTAA
ncbi:MAG: serine hydrolase domain-containing protein [Acidobacteriota bacterium]